MKTKVLKSMSFVARIIRLSLAMMLPILFIGSITVLLNGFPVQGYQEFLNTFMGGAFRGIILAVQKASVGVLAVYITVALNFTYMDQKEDGLRIVFRFGSLLGCLTGFFILVGFFTGKPDVSLLSGQGVFSGMLAGIIGSALFHRFEKMFQTRKGLFVDGADSVFNAALYVILPYLCVTLCFAVANYMITVCFDVESVQHLFMRVMDAIFFRMHRSYSSGLLFVNLVSVMWWFGIHGNNVLNQVAENLFVTILPGEIVSKSFIDTFVNMGGSGCTIGLLVAMMVFGKRASTKRLSGMAFLPGVFNIGELLVFGLPVIYNPQMAIPFILAPMLCFTNAYVLTKVGYLPYVTNEVVWTTPALMSGYLATGSVRGVVVQLLNILISAACYAPFLVFYEKKSADDFSLALSDLVERFKKSEATLEEVVLTDEEGNVGRLAKSLATDLEDALTASVSEKLLGSTESPLLIKYQPQYNSVGKCVGTEALLRWNHVKYGIVYPPLVIRIAKESRKLYDLETYIIENAIRDSEEFRDAFGEDFKLSVNVTATTFYDKRFIPFLQEMAIRYKLKSGNICLEITEETELITTEATGERMKMMRAFGYVFALDDFSMGHTSLQYLQHNPFDFVKLDGNLVKSLLHNERTKEIIASIVYLSESLDFQVIAEYVETEEERDALDRIGCHIYQGYLYSPAVEKETLVLSSNG